MANTVIYRVRKGDTLSEIAVEYDTTVPVLVKLNDIKDPDYIVVDQQLEIQPGITDVDDIEAPEPKVNPTYQPSITNFGLQSNTDRTMYVTWSWDKDGTDGYQVMWHYDTGDGVWFIGSDSNVSATQSLYTAPQNAKRVKVKVKAIPQKTDNGTTPWTSTWSTEKEYTFEEKPVDGTPSAPSVTIENYKLTAELSNLPDEVEYVEFEVVRDDATVFSYGKATVSTNAASYSCNIEIGSVYKVRCRSMGENVVSEWSPYSSNVETVPDAPARITTCRATSNTSVYLEWSEVSIVKTFDIEYTTNTRYFDGSNQTTLVTDIEFNHYEIGGLESGVEYYFRVRAINNAGRSAWSEIESAVVGSKPSIPTTWSSTTTAVVGEPLILYWVHNTVDGSWESFAELELYIDGVKETRTIRSGSLMGKTNSVTIDTSVYLEGTVIQWRVRTAGITSEYGDWSIQRTVDIYAPPTLQLNLIDKEDNLIEVLESFPLYVSALAGPATQLPTGYHVTVTSNDIYESVDNLGNVKTINKGESIYSKYFDVSDPLMIELSAHNIDLENNINYTVTVMVVMNSGLTTSSSRDFKVAWTDIRYDPNAEIGFDKESLVTYIRPYCEDGRGNLVEDVMLSVYRREFDGSFTELITGLNNTSRTFITDPHPALDYARYRIVAVTKSTGAISYYDMPGYPIGEKSIVIQWDEDWNSFKLLSEDPLEQPPWVGSMVKLPYNVDISDQQKPDVSFVKYIGRQHPVAYYGTHLGTSSTWKTEIDKNDTDTLYALRRLSIWMGNVYAREPSGSGYWANVNVSFGKTHQELTIPVTIEVTRVEGGI